MRKALYGTGGPITDGNLNPIIVTRKQAQREANIAATKTVKRGLSDYAEGHVFETDSYYRINVSVSKPRGKLQ